MVSVEPGSCGVKPFLQSWPSFLFVPTCSHTKTRVCPATEIFILHCNPLTPGSNARRFYSSTGGNQGTLRCHWVKLSKTMSPPLIHGPLRVQTYKRDFNLSNTSTKRKIQSQQRNILYLEEINHS